MCTYTYCPAAKQVV